MPDAIAPAAPAPAAPASTSTTAAPAPVAKPAVKAGPAAGRTTGGQFLPKESTAGVAKPEEKQPGETKEEYRFRRKLKVFGKEEDLDMSEDDLGRELQELRMHRKKTKDSQDATTRAQRLIELATQDPESFLRETGKDPDEFARSRLTAAAQVAAMTEEERKIHELTQRAEALEAEKKDRDTKAKEWKERHQKQQIIEQKKAVYKEALAALGEGTDHQTIGIMAAAERAALERGVRLDAQDLAKETLRTMGGMVEQYLGTLDGKGLVKKLGPKRIQAILEASISDFEASHGIATAAPTAPPAAPEPNGPTYLSEREIERRLKGLR